MDNAHNTHKTAFTKALEKIEDIAPSGMILAVIVTLAFEGFFQYIFWGEMFPRLKDWHRCYAAGSIATFIGMFRLWFLVMSSRDIAAGNIRVALLGICASIGLMVYCIWECYHIGARWSSEVDKDTVIAMLIFTTCIVIVAEVRLMMSRYGSWRNSAQQAAEAIAEAEARAEAAEKCRTEAEAEAGRVKAELLLSKSQAEAEAVALKDLHLSELSEVRAEAERALTSVTSSLSEAEAAHARCRDYVAQVEAKLRQAEAEVLAVAAEKQRIEAEVHELSTQLSRLESEAEVLRAELVAERNRGAEAEVKTVVPHRNGIHIGSRNGNASGSKSKTEAHANVPEVPTLPTDSGSDWPSRLAEAFRKFRNENGRNPSPLELATAAGTSDKTERKYRSQYTQLI